MITFNDIFKSSFLSNAASFSMIDAVLAIVTALILGFVLFFVHKKTFQGVMYSVTFGVSLIAMTMITALLIVAVTSNIILSLGMVGALSIVRFRTAVKEPIDIAFIFWAVATGIVVGAGLIPLAVFGTVVIGLFFLIFMNIKSAKNPYILVVSVDSMESETELMNQIKGVTRNFKVKSKVTANGLQEITIELFIKNDDIVLVNNLSGIPGVLSTALVSYNGEYMS